jgi:hypoxanthine phosphoribosyltransferase
LKLGGPEAEDARSTMGNHLYLSAETIQARVTELGTEITRDYQGKNLLMVSILKGAVFFLADLARAVDLPLEIDLLAISSYNQEHEETGSKAIRFLKDLDRPLTGKDVLVVEHIIDTGLTLHYIMRSLALRDPRSLAVCTLLDRPHRRLVDVNVRYQGFSVPDDFFVGYGFGFRQTLRNLPHIAYLPAESD